jgi:hypothetical protein
MPKVYNTFFTHKVYAGTNSYTGTITTTNACTYQPDNQTNKQPTNRGKFAWSLSPQSSGSILYIYNNWYVFWLSVNSLLAGLRFYLNPATILVYCIYSIPPDDGL